MKKEKASFRKRCWEFMDRHPKLSVWMSSLDEWSNKAVPAYMIAFAVVVIGAPVALVYCTLPEGIRVELSAICGTLLSVVVMPFILNNYNRKRDNVDKQYEKNAPLYEELADILVTVLSHPNEHEANELRMRQYIKKYYPKMCMSFSSSLIANLYSTYRDCKNKNYGNVKFFGEKCLVLIRKEGNIGKTFNLSTMILEMIQESDAVETRK